MTKRRAESALLWDIPRKKCLRSLSNTETQFAVVQNAGAPPSFTTLIGRAGQRRRKRPNCSEDHESKDALSSQKKALSDISSDSLDATENDNDSGKFQDASRTFVQRPSCTQECASKRSKKETRTRSEHLSKVMHDDDDDGDLCAFNSFQFWRTPLPDLDLSLLDNQSATEPNGAAPRKDQTEAMET